MRSMIGGNKSMNGVNAMVFAMMADDMTAKTHAIKPQHVVGDAL